MNQRFTFEEFCDFKVKTFNPITPVHFLYPLRREYVINEFGRCAVVYAKYSTDIILFTECEWCGSGNSLDKNDCCIHCGGPVE